MYNTNSSSHRNSTSWNTPIGSSYSSANQLYPVQNVTHSTGSKRSYSPDQYDSYPPAPSISSKTFHGYVTRVYDSWGLIDNEIQFSFSVCSKGVPKINEYVTAEASHSPSTTYKWKATKVQLSTNGRDYSNSKSVTSSKSESDYKRSKTSTHSRERSRDRDRDRDRDRRYDDGDRKRFKRDDRDDRPRDTEKDSHRERDRHKDHERSPARRSRTPIKRKHVRYNVKVPSDTLSLLKAEIITLKKRYPALYIPSDFCSSKFTWSQVLSLDQPYTLDKPCNFHIMHKICDSKVQNDTVYNAPDLDYSFSAKVMLMAIPNLEDIYKKTICTAEELHKEDEKSFTQLARLIQFLVGSRGKGEPLAIGGPWSPSLDGDNPKTDSSVLIRTAIRTCKALTGIDLSSCLQWYRFMEVYYHRSESVHKGKTIPARMETVVFFLPEVWNCVPSIREWRNLTIDYKQILQEKLQSKVEEDRATQANPVEQAEESDKEEDLVVIDKCEEKLEPTHYSELDPENMRVNDLRQELEARSLSTKGLKPQLVQRLELALRKEKDAEAESSSDSSFLSKFMKEHNEIKLDTDMKVVDEIKATSEIKTTDIDEATTDVGKNEEVDADKAMLEKRYTLPSIPHIIVHPSRTAKSGKFDCQMMSLANLLDYRTSDNKEHSFELYLFAELFHEMLQRDFGFIIYKALCRAPEKVKEEKNDKDPKKNVKETKHEPAEKDVKIESTNESGSTKDNADQTHGKEKSSNKDDSNVEESENEDRVKLVTSDQLLLLAFMFFDRNRCGYILERDLENLLLSLGLQLSRHQIKRLISKVSTKDTILYRKITDKPENDKDIRMKDEDLAASILGNEKYFPIFDDSSSSRTGVPKNGSGDGKVFDAGSTTTAGFVDIENITASLRRSETERLESEQELLKYRKENESLKESMKRLSEKEKKAYEDLRAYRDKVSAANREKISLTNKSKSYYKALLTIKDVIRDIEAKEKVSSSSKKSSSDKSEDKSSSKSARTSVSESENNEKNESKEKSSTNEQETKVVDEKIETATIDNSVEQNEARADDSNNQKDT